MPCHKISKLETRKEASKWHNYLNYEGRAQDVDDDACSSSGERNKMQIDLVPAQLLGRDNPASLGRCCSAHLHNYWSPRRQRRRLTICLIAALRLPDRLFNCSSRVRTLPAQRAPNLWAKLTCVQQGKPRSQFPFPVPSAPFTDLSQVKEAALGSGKGPCLSSFLSTPRTFLRGAPTQLTRLDTFCPLCFLCSLSSLG